MPDSSSPSSANSDRAGQDPNDPPRAEEAFEAFPKSTAPEWGGARREVRPCGYTHTTMQGTQEGLTVYGAGGHACVVLDAALLGSMRVDVLFDDAPKVTVLYGVPVRLPAGPEADFWLGRRFIVAIGDNRSRSQVFTGLSTLGAKAVNVLHPRAFVSPRAGLGGGVFLAALAVVNPGSQIGDNCILNTASSVDHDCRVGPDVHLCPGVRLAGGVVVGASSFIGTGASVLPGVRIGVGCVIGAGAVVRASVPDYSVAVGVPARVVRCVPPPSQAAAL